MIKLITQLLDWIYRKNCYFCHKPSDSGFMCEKCFNSIEINSPEPIKVISGIKIYSAGIYTGEFRKLIRGLKYHKQKEFALYFAKILLEIWNQVKEDGSFEIIPMPLHPKRQKKRGYNHMELIAREFSALTGYGVNSEIAVRIKDTVPQYGLKKYERAENMKDAFKINPEHFNGKKILIIDDLCTTGATLAELINSFKKSNIKDLCVIVGAVPEGTSFYQM